MSEDGRRAGRRVRKAVIVVVVLAALAFGADRGAEVVVGMLAAERAQSALGTPGRPDIDFGGFPFLTQLARGRFERVSVDIDDADAGRVRVAEIDARLRGVRRAGGGLDVESLSGEGLITYPALERRARGLGVSYGGDGLVRLSASADFLGIQADVSASGAPRIEGRTLIVRPERVSAGGASSSELAERIPELRVRLRDIPAGVDVDLRPTERGVEFSFSGTDATLRP